MEGSSMHPRRIVYDTPWPSFALAWSLRAAHRFRFALCSCIEQENNHLQIVQLNEETGNLEEVSTVEHSFPATKVMFLPEETPQSRMSGDLLASTGTALYVWRMEENQVKMVTKLQNTRSQQAPLTAFDWSVAHNNKVGVSSVDTTCTIWDLERERIETQLIAHDKAVYDIAFLQRENLFASVGADGSVRVFDQRNLDHSTIVYEAQPPAQLLRLSWNKINPNHIATIATDTPGVILIDIRRPSMPLATLSTQDTGCVNHLAWAPHSRNHLLCGTDDGQGLIWDVKEVSFSRSETQDSSLPRPALYSYQCASEVFQVQWPSSQPDYVALGSTSKLEVLRV
mmetsp:Transcript_20103/g.46227  ORF Transcript_20103/g.46227 Transcript_20103/m.46227 type:complete len:340 (-) Transcript_20103:72-1091(-)